MPIEFQLSQRPAGFALSSSVEANTAQIQCAEMVPATDPAAVQQRLSGLQEAVFRCIPGFQPTKVAHVLVLIRQDLTATAYVDELTPIAKATITRSVENGENIFVDDVSDVVELELGIDVPEDVGVVHYLSMEWRRSVYFDFTPLLPQPGPRIGTLELIAAQQLMSLWGLSPDLQKSLPTSPNAIANMSDGVERLRALITRLETKETDIQELLQENPWMFGGIYKSVQRHAALDDANIPDFTATRSSDDCHDIIELKLPSARCSNKDGSLSAEFSRHWDQAERYVDFAMTDRDYLLRQKRLKFDNPKVWLIIGTQLDDSTLGRIRRKERQNPRISVLSFDHLLAQAEQVLSFVRAAINGQFNLGPNGK